MEGLITQLVHICFIQICKFTQVLRISSQLCHTRIGSNLTIGINKYNYLQCFQGLADCTGTSKAIFFAFLSRIISSLSPSTMSACLIVFSHLRMLKKKGSPSRTLHNVCILHI
jgi:hypothetical protein